MGNSQWLSAALLTTLALIAQSGALQTGDGNPALQAFPLDQAGEHVFRFSQSQNREMTLLLQIEPSPGGPNRQELTHLRTIFEVTLVNQAGRTVCHAVGSPRAGGSTDKWVLRESRGEAAFWHRSCAELKLKRSTSYTLTVRLRDVDPKTPRIEATPVFERSDDFLP